MRRWNILTSSLVAAIALILGPADSPAQEPLAPRPLSVTRARRFEYDKPRVQIDDGGFEWAHRVLATSPSEWNFGDAAAPVLDRTAPEGKQSLRMTAGSKKSVTQIVKAPGRRIEQVGISCWLKSEGLDVKAKESDLPSVSIRAVNHNGEFESRVNPLYLRPKPDIRGLQEFTGVLPIAFENSDSVIVIIDAGSVPGTFWVDDVRLSSVGRSIEPARLERLPDQFRLDALDRFPSFPRLER